METILSLREVDMDRSPSPSQVPDSSQPVPPTDLVKWQSTQPLPALGALLSNPVISRPPRRVSHSTGQPTLFFSDELSSPDTKPSKTASTNAANRKVASRRARPRHSDSASLPTPAASPFSLSCPFASDDGQPSFVDILKSVSKMVDENAKIKKQRLEEQSNRTRRSNVPENRTKARDELIDKTNVGPAKTGGSSKGKERMKDLDRSYMDIDPDHGPFAMDVDTPTPQTPSIQSLPLLGSSASKMPPPPLPSKVVNTPARTHTSTSSYPSPPRDVRRLASPPPASACASIPPTPSFYRPPALGMRRTVNPTSHSHHEKALRSKQKSFKPPFAQPSTTAVVPNTATISRGSLATSAKKESFVNQSASVCPRSQTSLPTPETTPVIVTSQKTSSVPSVVVGDDPDSSFSELSFDLDILEEAMKEYD